MCNKGLYSTHVLHLYFYTYNTPKTLPMYYNIHDTLSYDQMLPLISYMVSFCLPFLTWHLRYCLSYFAVRTNVAQTLLYMVLWSDVAHSFRHGTMIIYWLLFPCNIIRYCLPFPTLKNYQILLLISYIVILSDIVSSFLTCNIIRYCLLFPTL